MIRLVCSEGDFTGAPFEEAPPLPLADGVTVNDWYDMVQTEAEAHIAFGAHFNSFPELTMGDWKLHHKNKENVDG